MNTIFTREKLDKLDELAEVVKDLTINNTNYYESNTATASDKQGDSTRNTETVTHTRNGNETVTHTRNRNFEQKLLSNWTTPVVVLEINLRIDQRISPIVVVP